MQWISGLLKGGPHEERAVRRMAVTMAFGVPFIVVYATQYGLLTAAWLSVVAVALFVALVAAFAGGVVGFLFGIPRGGASAVAPAASPPQPSPSPAGSPPAANDASGDPATPESGSPVTANTNLVEISDWLTKIIVGVGLIQLGSIPTTVHRLVTFLQPGLGSGSGAATATLAILVFYGLAGFLISYLWTRLEGTRAFARTQAALERRITAVATVADAAFVTARANEPGADDRLRATTKAFATQGVGQAAALVRAVSDERRQAEGGLRDAWTALESLLNDPALSVADRAALSAWRRQFQPELAWLGLAVSLLDTAPQNMSDGTVANARRDAEQLLNAARSVVAGASETGAQP